MIHRIAFRTDTELCGVVLDPERPLEPVLIDILFNDILFRTERACLSIDYRELQFIGEVEFQALRDRLKGVGVLAAGFSFEVPPYIPHSKDVDVTVRVHGTGELLFQERRNFNEDYIRYMVSGLGHVLCGRLSPQSIDKNVLSFSGHFRIIAEQEKFEVRSALGRSVKAATTRLEQSDLLRDVPGTIAFQIDGTVPLEMAADELQLYDPFSPATTVPRSSGIAIPPNCAAEFLDWIIPPASQMTRVMGFADNLAYYLGGYETYTMVDQMLFETLHRRLTDFPVIVDWGSGAGRLTQHLLRRTKASVHGFDIDGENAGWCGGNLGGGTFARVDLDPPMPMASGSVDLLIGISVFTHLTASAQDAWLAEIRRILKPNGVALVTIRSRHALCVGDVEPHLYRAIIEGQINDRPIGNLLNDVLAADDFAYYRETLHSHQYILNHWRNYFEVLEIREGAHFNYQDAVVLRQMAATPARTPRIGY